MNQELFKSVHFYKLEADQYSELIKRVKRVCEIADEESVSDEHSSLQFELLDKAYATFELGDKINDFIEDMEIDERVIFRYKYIFDKSDAQIKKLTGYSKSKIRKICENIVNMMPD